MARPRSQMGRNLRELKRAIRSLESAMNHIYTVKLSYDDHKDYQLVTFGKINKSTFDILDAIDMIATSCGQSITLLNMTIDEINNPSTE